MGANAVVRADVPDFTVVAGNPARVVRLVQAIACYNGSFSINMVLKLILRAAPFFLGGEMIKATFTKDQAEARAWLAAQRTQPDASSPT